MPQLNCKLLKLVIISVPLPLYGVVCWGAVLLTFLPGTLTAEVNPAPGDLQPLYSPPQSLDMNVERV